MKQFLLIAFLFLISFKSFSQPISADLTVNSGEITNSVGGPIDANNLSLNQIVRIRVALGNFISGVTIPAGHFRVKIGLGSGLVLNNLASLATAPLSNYFSWSYDLSGSQPQIVGNSIIGSSLDLPADFAQFADFTLKAVNSVSNSVVSFNFLVANPVGTTTPLSDPVPANNNQGNFYTISANAPLPVMITKFTAAKKDCNINVNWSIANQINLQRYDVEVSKDGRAYSKVAQVDAQNVTDYSTVFALTDALQADVLLVRLKMVDIDGTYTYSTIASVNANCKQNKSLAISGYPNPISDVNYITVKATDGLFSGKYKITLLDQNGKIYAAKETELNNVQSFKFDFGRLLGAGKYLINVQRTDGTQSGIIKFEKL